MSRLVVGVLAIMLASCGSAGMPTPTVCDGIPSEFGGCDPDRPVFTGGTCPEVGEEFGRQLSERAIPVFDGPRTVDGSDRTARLTHLVVLHVQLANKHLRDTGQVAGCDMPEFLDAAVASFPQAFKDRVGANAFHDRPCRSRSGWTT